MKSSAIGRVGLISFGLGLGLAVSFLLLELVLRIAGWPSPGLYKDGRGPLSPDIPSEDGGSWRHYSGIARLRHWDYDLEIYLNSHGFIEQERTHKDPGTWRIGLFGDSFAAGVGVEQDQRFGKIWWNDLSKHCDDRIEVYNFGSIWSGSGQNAAFLQSHGLEYELDQVILALFGGNELQDNELWERYQAEIGPSRAAVGRPDRTGWRELLRSRSRAAGFLYVTFLRAVARRDKAVASREFVSEHWQATEGSLEAFLEAAGGRPVSIWYLPAVHEWDEKSWQAAVSNFELSEDDRHSVRDRVQAWAKSRSIPFVDTTRFLQGHQAKEVQFARDGHWNATGHKLVGRELAATTTAGQCLRDRGTPKPSLEP